MTRPSISVLLPVRNGARFVARAVSSTLRALPADAELLVLDDGSTDSTPEVLDRVRDDRLRVLSGAGEGVAAGLNRLLEIAGADLVARMDADDVVLPGRFDRQVAAMGRGMDFVFAGHVRFGPSLRSFRQKRPWHLSSDAVRIWLALENPLLHPAMLGSARLVREAGGYRPGPAEDYDLWMRLAAAGARIERQLVPGIAYRMHPAQVTMGRSYLAALLRDPHLRNAHDTLTRSLGWSGGDVWPILWRPAGSAELQSRKDAYWKFLSERSRALAPFERRLFRQALDRTRAGSTAPGWEEDAEAEP